MNHTFETAVMFAKLATEIGLEFKRRQFAVHKLMEEALELLRAMELKDESQAFDELGDVMFMAIRVALAMHISPDEALAHATEKFRRRSNSLMFKRSCFHTMNRRKPNVEETARLWEEVKEEEREAELMKLFGNRKEEEL